MKYSFLIILMLGNIAFLTSCSLHSERTAAGLNIEKGILFYSDENNFLEEDSYYEALIELKQDYPDEFENYTIIAKNQGNDPALASLNSVYPALLVIKENKVVFKVTGNATKEDILKPVSNTLENW
ncbi:hypothetical protein [Bacillus sp. AK031]